MLGPYPNIAVIILAQAIDRVNRSAIAQAIFIFYMPKGMFCGVKYKNPFGYSTKVQVAGSIFIDAEDMIA
jgi:hypothetical protein